VAALAVVWPGGQTSPSTASSPAAAPDWRLAAAGTPNAPTVVFQEGFENASGTTPVALAGGSGYSAYSGAPTGTGAPTGAQAYTATAATTTGGFGGNTTGTPAIAGNQGAPGWLPSSNLNQSGCNGWIASYTTNHPTATSDPTCRLGAAQSGGVGGYDDSWVYLRALAQVLGQAEGQGASNTNHVLSAYTNSPFSTSYPNYPSYPTATYQNAGVQFQTPKTITVTPGHYYVGSAWYAAVNCNLAPPLEQFNLIYGTSTVQALGGQINVCTAAQNAGLRATTDSGAGVYHNVGTLVPGTNHTVPNSIELPVPSGDTYTPTNCSTSTTAFIYCGKGTNTYFDISNNMTPTTSTTTGFATAHIYSGAFIMPSGVTQVGLQLLNQQASGNGNDGAFDLPALVDATPTIDKSFSPATVETGQTSTLTFTVTNTSELAEKDDWAFTDQLPAGLTLANTTFGGTCANVAGTAFSRTGTAGGNTITVTGGDLAAGQASCTITANVTASATGTYTNSPNLTTESPAGNLTSRTGLLPGSPASVTFVQPTLAVSKQLGGSRQASGDQFTVAIHTGSATGPLLGSEPNATTTGTGSTVAAGTGTTGTQPAHTATTYYLTEAAAGTANLSQYTATITCTDSAGATTGLPSNQALPSSGYALTLGSASAAVSCVITNTPIAPPANLNIAKTFTGASVDPATGIGTATYSVAVTNSSATTSAYGPLTDTPGFASGVTATGASWTASGGPSGGSASGAGPYTLAPASTAIAGNATQTFTVKVTYAYSGSAGGSSGSSGASGSSSTLNPMALNGGFTTLSTGDTSMGNSSLEGSAAVGGNLHLTTGNYYAVSHSSGNAPTGYSLPVIDGDPTRLLIGGQFAPSGSSGVVQVSSSGNTASTQLGYVKVGNLGTLQVTSSNGQVWVANGAAGTQQAISDPNQPYVAGSGSTTAATASKVLSPNGFSGYFAGLSAAQTATTACLAGLGSNTSGVAQATLTGSDYAQSVNIVAGTTNLLQVPAGSPLLAGNRPLNLTGAALGATTTLVVQITGLASGGSVALPSLPSAASAPYVLWDLSGTAAGSAVTVGGNTIVGSVYAPGLTLTLNQNSPLDGSVFTQTLVTTGSGSIANYPFAGTVNCAGSGTVVTPPPSSGPAVPAGTCTGSSGNGLFNQAALPAGQESGSAADNSACGTLNALQLQKQNPSGVALDGSQWRLAADSGGSPGTASIPTVTASSSTGRFDVSGLPAGTYWLVETSAPTGYALASKGYQFTIAANGSITPGTSSSSALTAAMITSPSTGTWRITATDAPLYQLPLLGGRGPGALRGAGIGLLIAAAVCAAGAVRRRRPAPRRGRHLV